MKYPLIRSPMKMQANFWPQFSCFKVFLNCSFLSSTFKSVSGSIGIAWVYILMFGSVFRAFSYFFDFWLSYYSSSFLSSSSTGPSSILTRSFLKCMLLFCLVIPDYYWAPLIWGFSFFSLAGGAMTSLSFYISSFVLLKICPYMSPRKAFFLGL